MHSNLIIAVDIGIRNMGFVVYDPGQKQLLEWKRVDLCDGAVYAPYKNVAMVHNFIDKHANYFANCQMVLVERQMRVNMRILEAVFESRFFEKCRIIQAQAVKVHFSTCCRDYKKNKKRAVEWLGLHWNSHMIQSSMVNFNDYALAWSREPKKDDLADSMLMMLYFINTYSDLTQDAATGV